MAVYRIPSGDVLAAKLGGQQQLAIPDPFVAHGMPLWSAAVNAMLAGTRNAKIVCWGDSTTKGTGALSSGSAVGGRAHSYPLKLAGLLTAAGYRARQSSVNARAGEAATSTYVTYNPEVAFDLGTDYTQVFSTFGGSGFRTIVAASRMKWTPTGSVDTFVTYFGRSATGASANVYFDGSGTPTETFSVNGASGFIKKTHVVALGTHTIEFALSGSTEMAVLHCFAYNSALKEITVINGGFGGATAVIMSTAAAAYAPVQMVTEFAPDLTIINAGLNDFPGPTAQATFEAAMNAMVDTGQLSGDVLIVFPNSRGLVATEDTFKTYCQNVATAQDVALVDIRDVFGTLAAANAAGYMSGDSLHPSELGYTKIARDLILPAIT